MRQKPFPEIKDVQFKHLPSILGSIEQYAVSSDGHVWIGRNGWRKMEPYEFCDGDMAVMLQTKGGGKTMQKIKDLMSIFDD